MDLGLRPDRARLREGPRPQSSRGDRDALGGDVPSGWEVRATSPAWLFKSMLQLRL
jgi:hypothetical protein